MAEVNPPWAIEGRADHHANVSRDGLLLLNGSAEGILPNYGLGQMAVTQRGAGANISVDVAAGICAVMGDQNNVQGLYQCVNDAAKNVVIAAADPTNPRRDMIVARVQDAFYSGATNAWDLFVVQGTAAASPADPVMPNNAVCLARVSVAAAAASITNANIADLRPYVPVGISPVNSTRRPGVLYGPYSQEPAFKPVPFSGQHIYEIDTNLEYVFNGSVWVCRTPIANLIATSQTTTSTAFVDLATVGPTVTITTGTKALIRLNGFMQSNVATNGASIGFAISGATTLAASDINSMSKIFSNTANTDIRMGVEIYVTGLNAGVNVFTAKYKARVGGTATFSDRMISVVALPN